MQSFRFSPGSADCFTALVNNEPIAEVRVSGVSGESTIETRRPLTRSELSAILVFVDLKEGRQRLT
jgi:hypothetical protein